MNLLQILWPITGSINSITSELYDCANVSASSGSFCVESVYSANDSRVSDSEDNNQEINIDNGNIYT